MNQQEQARIKVLNSVLEYRLPIAQAAEIMGVSERHTKRLLAAYRKHGAAALAHGNRGRRPHNAVPEAAAAAVVKLASNGYAGGQSQPLHRVAQGAGGHRPERPTVRRILVRPASAVPAASVPSSTAIGVGACPRRACWCRSTAVNTPGWRPGTEADAAHRRGRRHRHRGPGCLPHHRGHPGLPGALGGLVRQWGIP